jgi:hypothetical protein
MPGSSKLCVSVQVSQTKAMHNSLPYACYTPHLSLPWSLKQKVVKSRDYDYVYNLHSCVALGYVVWNITFCGSSVGIVIVCRLDHMLFFCKQQLKTSLLSRRSDLASCSVDVVVLSPILKQLMHVADYSPLFSVVFTDVHICNCASCVCLHGVHRDMFSFYHCFVGMSPICMWT